MSQPLFYRTTKVEPVVWGRYDPSFDILESESYHHDVPTAEVHIV